MGHLAVGTPDNNQNSAFNIPSYDAPLPSNDQPGFSAPILGPHPGHFAEQQNQFYQPAGPYTEPTTPWPHFVPVDPVTQHDTKPIQPLQVQMPSYNVAWTTELFDCFDDPLNAIVTLCVPCVTFGQAAEIIDQGSTTCATHAMFYSCVFCFTVCPCMLSCSYRAKLRAKYNLMESPANDCLTHFFCEYCALCQMHRELVKRGLDPSIGWQANVQRIEQQKGQMAPPQRQAMM